MQVLGAPHFFSCFQKKSRERAVEMQSSSKVGELKTNFLFWDKEPLHLVEKEKGLVPYFFLFRVFDCYWVRCRSCFPLGFFCWSEKRDLVFNQKITVVLKKIIRIDSFDF